MVDAPLFVLEKFLFVALFFIRDQLTFIYSYPGFIRKFITIYNPQKNSSVYNDTLDMAKGVAEECWILSWWGITVSGKLCFGFGMLDDDSVFGGLILLK